MNLIEIGKFICSRRKIKNLTQNELAQKLNISEKTVSKWECGKGFPDSSLILPLCAELEINANELLSGKVLTIEEYKQKAEENIILLKSQQTNNTKFLFLLENVIGIMSSLTFIIMLFSAVFGVNNLTVKIIMIIFASLVFIVGITFALFVEQKAGFYKCSNCGYKYVPKFSSVYFAMHNGRNRFLKCPKCNKRTWNKKVIDKD